MMRWRIAFMVVAVALTLHTARAADTLRPRYGISIGINRNLHTADFRELPGVPNCCPRFESGSGYGLQVQTIGEVPVSSFLLVGARFGLNALNGTLTKDEQIPVAVNGIATQGVFRHTVNATLRSISIDPYLSVRLWGGLFAQAGTQIGYMQTTQYEQQERITQPTDGFVSFLDADGNDTRSRVRNQSSGTLPNAASLHLAVFGGLSYEFPMNSRSTLLLVPSLNFSYGLSAVVQNLSWSVNSITPSLGLRYSPTPKPRERIIYKENIDTLRTIDSTTSVSLVRIGVPRVDRVSMFEGDDIVGVETLYRTDTLIIGALTIAAKETGITPTSKPVQEETTSVVKNNVAAEPTTTPNTQEQPVVANKKFDTAPPRETVKPLDSPPPPKVSATKKTDDTNSEIDIEQWEGRCCYLMFLATESKSQANTLHDYVRKKLQFTKIITKKNSDGVVIYTVISRCSESPQSADMMMSELRQFIDRMSVQFKLPEAPRIKCFDAK